MSQGAGLIGLGIVFVGVGLLNRLLRDRRRRMTIDDRVDRALLFRAWATYVIATSGGAVLIVLGLVALVK